MKRVMEMEKNTSRIVEELGLCSDFISFYDENKEYMVSASLSEMLAELLSEKGLKKVDVIKRAELFLSTSTPRVRSLRQKRIRWSWERSVTPHLSN